MVSQFAPAGGRYLAELQDEAAAALCLKQVAFFIDGVDRRVGLGLHLVASGSASHRSQQAAAALSAPGRRRPAGTRGNLPARRRGRYPARPITRPPPARRAAAMRRSVPAQGILQRVGYIGIAIFCLLAAGINPLRKFFHGLAILAATYGLSVAGRQVWLLSHPESSCGIDPIETWINQFQLAQTLTWIFKADGLCSAKLPAILGLQVPEWSLFWFAVLFIALIITFFKKS